MTSGISVPPLLVSALFALVLVVVSTVFLVLPVLVVLVVKVVLLLVLVLHGHESLDIRTSQLRSELTNRD